MKIFKMLIRLLTTVSLVAFVLTREVVAAMALLAFSSVMLGMLLERAVKE